MHEIVRHRLGALGRRRGRQLDIPPSPEGMQHQTFADIFTHLRTQGKRLMKDGERRKLAGTKSTLYRPDALGVEGELKRIMPTELRLIDGATILWDGIPTALAYGSTPQGLVLVGAAHYPGTLSYNHINPKQSDRFSAMLGQFPGHFQFDSDHIAFCIGLTSDASTVGVVVGDDNPDNRSGLALPLQDLKNSATKNAALEKIATVIGGAIEKKFYGISL